MINPVIKVSVFTPVESEELSWIKPLTEYLSPLTCVDRIALDQSDKIDGSNGCISENYETNCLMTVLKVASYILSAGILPLLAALTLVALRCCYQFHWIQEINEPIAPVPPVDLPPPVTNLAARSFFPDRFTRVGSDVVAHILTFLDQQDLRTCNSVSKSVLSMTNIACQRLGRQKRPLPGVNDTERWLKFSNAIGPEVFREYFGEVEEAPPVPKVFIDRAQAGFKLVYIPEYITIEVGENSPLMLDETTAVNGKKARLTENTALAPREARTIQVPVTVNNIILLTLKYLKKDFPGRHRALTGCDKDGLAEHGDVGVGLSRWSYQKEALIGRSNSYQTQVQLAQEAGLEIVPLLDRIFFRWLSYMNSGKLPQGNNWERTSVLTHDVNHGWQWTIAWETSILFFRLSRLGTVGTDDVGAAAGVSAGSSQAIGH